MKNDAKQMIIRTRDYLSEIDRQYSLKGVKGMNLDRVRNLTSKTKHDLYEKYYCDFHGVKLTTTAEELII
jgi:hypothetical protein